MLSRGIVLKRHFSRTTTSMSKRISFKVDGTVQGVNYRSWAASKASSLNVTGYAQNTDDGSVVGEAQGDQGSLDKFVQHLNSGPEAAQVTQVEQKDIDTKSGDRGFERSVHLVTCEARILILTCPKTLNRNRRRQ
nr:acylphosphatase [Quercus suber]